MFRAPSLLGPPRWGTGRAANGGSEGGRQRDDGPSAGAAAGPAAGAPRAPRGPEGGVGGPELAIHEDEGGGGGVGVRHLTCLACPSEEDALNALFEAAASRTLAAHALNARSSRAHFVFTIHLSQPAAPAPPSSGVHSGDGATGHGGGGGEEVVVSKLHLVDLAGSERGDRTGATGLVAREASFINKSLSFLEQVVSSSFVFFLMNSPLVNLLLTLFFLWPQNLKNLNIPTGGRLSFPWLDLQLPITCRTAGLTSAALMTLALW